MASHFKGGQITYKYLGNGQYDILIKGYWDKDAVGNINPTYEGSPRLNTPSLTISKTLLPDGKTMEHVQQQRVTWSTPGLYQISWKSCCRANGSNFGSEQSGLFAAVNYDPQAPSSSPQFYDVPIFNFDIDTPINFSLSMEDSEGHEQQYSLETPFGVNDNLYQLMKQTGFDVTNTGTVLWSNPQKGLWLVNVKLREKIDGQFTGAFVLRDFILNVLDDDNNAPVFAPMQPQVVSLGETLNFEVTATDAAGQSVSLQASSSVFEKGASFTQTATGNIARGTFSWTPDALGSYNVQFTATDNNLIPLSAQMIVPISVVSPTEACAVMVSASIAQQPCGENSNGLVHLQADHGTAPYTYSLDGGQSFQASDLFNGLGAGTYTAVAKDATGCTSQSATVIVTAAALPEIIFSEPVITVCQGAAPFTMSGASPTGGVYTSAYVENGLFNPTLAGPGKHAVVYTYTNTNGCSSSATMFVVVNTAPTANAGEDKTVFFGYKDYNCTTLTASATGGNAAFYTYSWSTGETTASIQVCPTATTTYTLTVTDASGCTSTDEVTVEVVDVRCGNKKKLDKVTVCHKGKPICIAPAAVQAHLAHGDVLGDCSTGSNSSPEVADTEEIAAEDATEEEEIAEAELLLYPNPINDRGQLTLKLKEADYVVLDIVDMNGKVVTKLFDGEVAANQEMTFNINRSIGNKNIYIGRLSTSKGSKFIKLVITQ
ncbi:T9SS type A sorting domain-containing protein [Pontibacter anaerobius]|uniref:T9SS type A sorting domain-containing protein n=1 Tax=Pontibacter anaerobius TaxID=2993940 RepID=A0ABT3RFJ0_9BACT|nr:T9SS type A sorting domain-containing protein [Pontibacter anaerobius]MCX2740612.1 T9SS type A sorting domain-containing protein [Pontibacter anaerobius]